MWSEGLNKYFFSFLAVLFMVTVHGSRFTVDQNIKLCMVPMLRRVNPYAFPRWSMGTRTKSIKL